VGGVAQRRPGEVCAARLPGVAARLPGVAARLPGVAARLPGVAARRDATASNSSAAGGAARATAVRTGTASAEDAGLTAPNQGEEQTPDDSTVPISHLGPHTVKTCALTSSGQSS
jgi:hypothetical protein